MGTLPPHPGGSAIVGAQLVVGLARLGHSVRALAPITAEALRAGDRFAAGHPELGVTRYEVPFFEVALETAGDDGYHRVEHDRIAERFPRLVGEHRPSVVVVGRETFAWHVPDLARAHSLPSMLLVQRDVTHGILGLLGRAAAERLVDQFRKADLVILVAEHVGEQVRRVGLREFRVIPNGVDPRAFAPRPKDRALLRRLDLRDDHVVVLHASNLKAVKRPLDIVGSAEQVLRHDPAVVYVILGDGPDRPAMEDDCRRRGILDHFRFVGWVDHERVPEYLNLADIVVMPSEAEALSLVYLEAQACGRLLLASDIPAAREVVEDGQTGLLFRRDDVDHFAAQTLRAAGDPGLRAAIGRRARDSVRAHDLDRTVAAYEHALRELAGRPRR